MALLESHLEQISLSAQSIHSLEFPRPKIFTNALLGDHEITTLIRDTEPHERALFSLNPDVIAGEKSQVARRQTSHSTNEYAFGRKSIYSSVEPRKKSAVARVLGPEMLREIQNANQNASRSQGKRGVDVEVLLKGAEKLCAVYPVQGATEKIASLRNRHHQIAESVTQYEEKVRKHQAKIDRMNRTSDYEQHDHKVPNNSIESSIAPVPTEADLLLEKQEIEELEQKRRDLEDRVAGMEKDLGGLLR